ncbi:hypothetical protein D3C84_246350 [compost metagenome]
MGVEPVDDLLGEQGGVGGHHEVHRLAQFGEARLAVLHHRLDQRPVGQRLAAEEHHGVARLVGRLLEQHLHRRLGGVQLHLLAGRRLVEVFLVAVGTAQVAAGVDVEHHGVQRRALDPLHGDFRSQRRAVADHLQRQQLAQSLAHLAVGEARRQALHQLLAGAGAIAQRVDDFPGHLVGGEQRAAGHMKQQPLGLHAHLMQVALDQIQDNAHGNLPESIQSRVWNRTAGGRPVHLPIRAAAGCSSAAR